MKELLKSFSTMTEQDLGKYVIDVLDIDDVDKYEYAFDRSCTPHCLEVVAELGGGKIPTLADVQSYTSFITGAINGGENGIKDTDLYKVDDGWSSTKVAELARVNGYKVVLQRLTYDQDNTNIDAAIKSGRIQSKEEEHYLNYLAQYGGEKSDAWLFALQNATTFGGYVVCSIVIPSSKNEGQEGRHSVLCTDISGDDVIYFEPDGLCVERYGSNAGAQMITRLNSDERLFYKQPKEKFLSRMSGEVMYIFPPGKKLPTERSHES